MIKPRRFFAILSNLAKHLPKGFFDYFYFPFDHNQPLPVHSLDECFRPVIHFLNQSNIEYFVTDGSLLGLYRDSRLIPHDNDFDIALISAKPLFSIIRYCFKSGWLPGRILFSLKTFRLVQLVFYKKEAVLDFCVWTKRAECMQLSVPEVRGVRSQPAYFYSHTSLYNTDKLSFKTHPDPEEWLKLHYGSTWNIPKDHKGDWREDTTDIIEY